MDCSLEEEADAFDKRIEGRVENGFIPDLRKLKHNPFFYKSFWRDPCFTKLYLGEICNNFIEKLAAHTSPGARVLDLGCGAGYLALEIARQGYNVTGIDISASCINVAKKTLDKADISSDFGSLKYQRCSVSELSRFNQFDAVMCSGVLHHLEPLPESLNPIHLSMKTGGVILWHEPQHQYWTKTEASIVTLIRLILANLNMWHDEKVKGVDSTEKLMKMIDDVYEEYIYERDPHEKKGQSPNDLASDRDYIVSEIEKKFRILDIQQSFSFIYRLMGGMRGDQETLNRLASLLHLFDTSLSQKGIINSNYFYGTAIKS